MNQAPWLSVSNRKACNQSDNFVICGRLVSNLIQFLDCSRCGTKDRFYKHYMNLHNGLSAAVHTLSNQTTNQHRLGPLSYSSIRLSGTKTPINKRKKKKNQPSSFLLLSTPDHSEDFSPTWFMKMAAFDKFKLVKLVRSGLSWRVKKHSDGGANETHLQTKR